LPIALSDAQVRDLLCRVRNPIHKACFAVMYACGLRLGEAATLEVGSVDKANLLLRVIGKGNTERRVPLPQPVLDDLRTLWRTHQNPARLRTLCATAMRQGSWRTASIRAWCRSCSKQRQTAHEHPIEARIYYPFHPRYGETVLIIRQYAYRQVGRLNRHSRMSQIRAAVHTLGTSYDGVVGCNSRIEGAGHLGWATK
jgi:hypothetical protein